MIEQYPIPPPQRDEIIVRHNPIESCGHEYELRCMTLDNGAVQYKKQCVHCGEGSPAIAFKKLSKLVRDNAPPYDQNLKRQTWQNAREGRRESEEQYRERWFEWYNGYLASSVWQRRRAAVIKRSRGVCESCSKERATIAHHLTYEHVGAEPLFELVAVCSPCHDQIHRLEE